MIIIEGVNLINIVCACDDRYVKHLAVLIISIINNTKTRNINFYIINGGIHQENIDKLEEIFITNKAKFRFLMTNEEEIKKLKVDKHLSTATYYRILIPNLLSNDIDKVVYLDSDIVVNGDISELWNMDISEFSIGAKKEAANYQRNEYLNMPKKAPYFNAGVLLMNLNKWRQCNHSSNVFTYLNKFGDNLLYHDQDGINALLYNDSLEIQSEWNILSQDVYGNSSFRGPKLVHFTEASKPWQLLNNHPFKKEYEKYLAMTPWKDDTPPENAIIHKLLMDKRIIIFGSGGSGLRLLERVMELNGTVSYFLDNNKELSGKEVNGKKIHTPNVLADETIDEIFIIIASMYYVDIEKQLTELGLKRLKHFVSLGYENELLKEW